MADRMPEPVRRLCEAAKRMRTELGRGVHNSNALCSADDSLRMALAAVREHYERERGPSREALMQLYSAIQRHRSEAAGVPDLPGCGTCDDYFAALKRCEREANDTPDGGRDA